MDKEIVVHICNGIVFSHKINTFESVLMSWMNLEPIIKSELSQKKKNNYCILTDIYRIQKNGTEEFYSQGHNGETDKENRLMDMGRGEERVRCMERVTQKLTLSYVKYIANENSLYGSENSNRGSISMQRSGRREGGSEVREYMYTSG